MVSLRALVTAALLPLVTALTAQDIVKNIETLTNKTDALQAPAQSITILNAPLIVIGKGPLPVSLCLSIILEVPKSARVLAIGVLGSSSGGLTVLHF